MIVALGAIIVAIWILAIYGTIQEEYEMKYDVTVRPGAVSYGTHSSATMPMVSSPTRHTSAPMISGSAVRSYAHYGHATMPGSGASSGYRMHTTSSAKVQNIGSGSGGGGGTASSSGSRGASSRGMSYSGGSVSMPILSVNSSLLTTSSVSAAEASAPRGIGPRRAKPTDDGTQHGQEMTDTEDGVTIWTWDEDKEDWVNTTPTGTKKYDSLLGYMVEWNGSEWVKVENQTDPEHPTPLGATPWHWMLLLALGYGIAKMRLRKQNKVQ